MDSSVSLAGFCLITYIVCGILWFMTGFLRSVRWILLYIEETRFLLLFHFVPICDQITRMRNVILFDVFRLYRKKQESLSFIRVPASVLLFSSQYGIHLDDQFQDTAEFHLLMSFFPCKDALPGGVLAVFDKDVEGGTDAVLFHQLLIFHTFFM